MTDQNWARGTFVGTELGQAEVIAALTPDERLRLLEALVDLAVQSGALQRSRDDKQSELDRIWRT